MGTAVISTDCNLEHKAVQEQLLFLRQGPDQKGIPTDHKLQVTCKSPRRHRLEVKTLDTGCNESRDWQ